MSINLNDEMKKTSEVAVLTKDGEKLIGLIVELNEHAKKNPMLQFLANSGQTGIYLKRKHTMSFLAGDNIEFIRLAKPGEKEIDFK